MKRCIHVFTLLLLSFSLLACGSRDFADLDAFMAEKRAGREVLLRPSRLLRLMRRLVIVPRRCAVRLSARLKYATSLNYKR